jgi:Domain of unknown function (DUF4082)
LVRRAHSPGTSDGSDSATLSASDSAAIELGMAFTPSSAGVVTTIRFDKGAGNTEDHTGSI